MITINTFNAAGNRDTQDTMTTHMSVYEILHANVAYGSVTRNEDTLVEFTFHDGCSWVLSWTH
jgi:hypothetical protein